jgi:hypothetical protein
MTTINTGRDGAGFESERNSFLRKKNQDNYDLEEKRIGGALNRKSKIASQQSTQVDLELDDETLDS